MHTPESVFAEVAYRRQLAQEGWPVSAVARWARAEGITRHEVTLRATGGPPAGRRIE